MAQNQCVICVHLSAPLSSNTIILQSVFNAENLITPGWGFTKPSALIQFLTNIPCHSAPSASVTTTHLSGLILQVHLVRAETDLKGPYLIQETGVFYLPTHRGHFPQLWPAMAFWIDWTMTDTHWASFCGRAAGKAPPFTPYLTFSAAQASACLSESIFAIPKGQVAQPWKTVEILTLAINAHKLGNLSCFIMLFPATRQRCGLLIGKQKTNDWPWPFLIFQFLLQPFVLKRSGTCGSPVLSCDCVLPEMLGTGLGLAPFLFTDL